MHGPCTAHAPWGMQHFPNTAEMQHVLAYTLRLAAHTQPMVKLTHLQQWDVGGEGACTKHTRCLIDIRITTAHPWASGGVHRCNRPLSCAHSEFANAVEGLMLLVKGGHHTSIGRNTTKLLPLPFPFKYPPGGGSCTSRPTGNTHYTYEAIIPPHPLSQ